MSVAENNLLNLTLIGAGNLAWHLGHAFKEAGIQVNKIINRSIDPAVQLAQELETTCTSDFRSPNQKSQFTIFAIDDSSIENVLHQIDTSNTIVIHTSGSIGIEVFNSLATRFGVLYPFQSFTKNIEVDFSKVPVCIEASDEQTQSEIAQLATSISKHVHYMNSEQRRILHLAGTMVNNFTNHIVLRAFALLEKNNLDKKMLLPLLEETIKKIKLIGPEKAQTGPARRKNYEIIEKHLKIIENETLLKNLYQTISEGIIEYYSTNS